MHEQKPLIFTIIALGSTNHHNSIAEQNIKTVFVPLDICYKKFYIPRSRLIALRPLDGHCYNLYDYFR